MKSLVIRSLPFLIILTLSSLAITARVKNGQTEENGEPANLSQAFHLATESGWSNDLQTISWNQEKGYYDVYFLHSKDGATDPFGPSGQDWQHTTTRDFISYSQQDTALNASGGDPELGWKSAWTGSVITNKTPIPGVQSGQKVSYFTGLQEDGGQAIYAATSTNNGLSFDQVLNDGKPLLTKENAPNGRDFRDPYIFYFKDKLLMYVAEGDVIGVYQSQDGLHWEKADSNGPSKILNQTFFQGRSWEGNAPVECPVLKTMETPDGQSKQVLFFGAKDASQGETTGTYYTVGHLDTNGLFAAETDTRRLDQGSDYYGANFTGSDDSAVVNQDLISLGWVGNWHYFTKGIHSDQEAQSDFMSIIGFYSSPRHLQLNQDLTIQSSPLYNRNKEELAIRNRNSNISTQRPLTSDNREAWIDRSHAQEAHGLVDLANQDAWGYYQLHFNNLNQGTGMIYFDIWQGADYVKIAYNTANSHYQVATYAAELNRSLDGSQTASSYYYDGLLGGGRGYTNASGVTASDSLDLTIITDNRSLEIFFPNGQSYTLARFNTSGQQDFKVFTSIDGLTLDMKVYDVHP